MTTELKPGTGGEPPEPPMMRLKKGPSLEPVLHHLERIKILRPRSLWRFLREFRHKEWWYTGAYHPESKVYVSWYFIRVNFVDKFVMTIFDPSRAPEDQPHLVRTCRLAPGAASQGVSLVAHGKGELESSYRLLSPQKWLFTLDSTSWRANVQITQRVAPFTKFDFEMRDHYAIIHYFQSMAEGQVTDPAGRVYPLDGALVYQDHCFGKVPRRTGWHWIAVQSEDVALTVLVNYGDYPQRFAQVWFAPSRGAPRGGEWVRLEQNVSFEHEYGQKVSDRWSVTSTDLLLEVTPHRQVTDTTKAWPVITLSHTEMHVSAVGKVRIDGRWVDTGELKGVMEEHFGSW